MPGSIPGAASAGGSVLVTLPAQLFVTEGTPDVFPDFPGYAAHPSPSRACRIVLHPSAFLSFPLRYHSM